MDLFTLSLEYRSTAQEVESRLQLLKQRQKETLGPDSFLLENRMAALRAELLELRRTAAYLAAYNMEVTHGYQTQS